MKQDISSIYCLKSLAAFFVLLIHFHFYGQKYLSPVTMSAVYIFYIIGGYFIGETNDGQFVNRIFRTLKKLVRLTIITNVVYFLLEYLFNGVSRISSFQDFIRLIIHGDNISGHLWFLNGYIIALIFILFVYWIVNRLQAGSTYFYGVILFASIFVFLYGILTHQYSFFVQSLHFFVIDNIIPITIPIPMICMGILIRKTAFVLSQKWSLCFFLSAVFFTYIENRVLCYFDIPIGGNNMGVVVMAIAFLCLALSKKDFGKDSILYRIGKYHSANIYFWHYLPVLFFGKWIYSEPICNYSALIVLIVMLPFSLFLNKILKMKIIG